MRPVEPRFAAHDRTDLRFSFYEVVPVGHSFASSIGQMLAVAGAARRCAQICTGSPLSPACAGGGLRRINCGMPMR